MSELRRRKALRSRDRKDAKLVAVSISNAPLGGRVDLNLEPKRTVLVGRNGAGKSLFLESLNVATDLAVRRDLRDPRWGPSITSFGCEIRQEAQCLDYSFERIARKASIEDDPGSRSGVVWDWTEKCINRSVPKEAIWKVNNGIASMGEQEIKLERGIGLLGVAPPPSVHVPDELSIVRGILARVTRVSAGVPRGAESRAPLFLMRDHSNRDLWVMTHMHGPNRRVEFVARSILSWYELDREKFDEYDALGRRLGLWSKLQVSIVPTAIAPLTPNAGARDVGVLLVDDVNWGYLSDGTLRVAEILAWLISATGRVLLIEEPETSIHPGLLRQLLNEIDSYSLQTQVVVSTHSPDVVSQSQPNELRLVRRVRNKTSIESLSQEQFDRLNDYLRDEGTLGEFMFGGGVDD